MATTITTQTTTPAPKPGPTPAVPFNINNPSSIKLDSVKAASSTLSSTTIAGWTSTQIANIPPNAIQGLSTANVSAISTKVISSINVDQINALSKHRSVCCVDTISNTKSWRQSMVES